MSVFKWSQTPGSNDDIDSTINLQEGQSPGSLNNSARAMMAAIAKWRDDMSGNLVTGGTSTAITVTTNQGFTALTDGISVTVRITTTSGASPTFSPDGLTAKSIASVYGTAIGDGALIAGSVHTLVYDATDDKWIVHNTPGVVYAFDGSAASPSIAFTSDNDTGFYWASSGVFHAVINGSSVGFWNSTGLNLTSNLVLDCTGADREVAFTMTAGDVRLTGSDTGDVVSLYDEALAGARWSTNATGDMTVYNDLTAGGDVTAYSDAGLKTDVETIDLALGLVKEMRGVRYTRIDSGERGVGVIAQEMVNVLPEVVKDGKVLSVAYGNIVGVLIEAIKELEARVAALEDAR